MALGVENQSNFSQEKDRFFILVVCLIGRPLQSNKTTYYYSIVQRPFATSVINPIFLLALFIDRSILATGPSKPILPRRISLFEMSNCRNPVDPAFQV